MRRLKRALWEMRKKSLCFSVRQLASEVGLLPRVSLASVYRALQRMGFLWRSLKRKGVLTDLDRKRRVSWCRIHIKLPLSHWRDISIYLDCVSFLFKKNPGQAARTSCSKSWLRRCERLRLTTKGRHEHDSKSQSVRFLMGVCYEKGCVLCVPYEDLTGPRFAALLRKHLPGAFRKAGKRGRVVLQDNCPVQNSLPARNAFAALGATRQLIPARSPDLNPIENIFNCCKRALAQDSISEGISLETLEGFKARVDRTMKKVSALYADRTIDSMPRRIADIVGSLGERAAY